MPTKNPNLELEITLHNQIYESLQGQWVDYLFKLADLPPTQDDHLISIANGTYLKVSEKSMRWLYSLCQKALDRLAVQDKLRPGETVEFYIANDPVVNAWTYSTEQGRHLIILTSSLYNLLDEDELCFVLGHELGHILMHNAELARLVRNVFPEREQMPLLLGRKVFFHKQLAELVADRYGYLACLKLDSCLSALYKLVSGIDLKEEEINLDDLLDENYDLLDEFIYGDGQTHLDEHPVNPIRVEALRCFAFIEDEQKLNNRMSFLTDSLLDFGDQGPLYEPLTFFMASAGIIISLLDQQGISIEEREQILLRMSDFDLFPRRTYEKIEALLCNEDPWEVLVTCYRNSVECILSQNSELAPSLLEYMMSIIIADKEINEQELDFLFRQGQAMGVSRQQIACIFAELIQKKFSPSYLSIS